MNCRSDFDLGRVEDVFFGEYVFSRTGAGMRICLKGFEGKGCEVWGSSQRRMTPKLSEAAIQAVCIDRFYGLAAQNLKRMNEDAEE